MQATGLQAFESKLTSLADSVAKMPDSLSRVTQTATSVFSAEDDMALLEEDRLSKFDPSEGILVEDQSLEAGELPYEDLFKDSEDCGPKVYERVAKRVNSTCTKSQEAVFYNSKDISSSRKL